MAHVVRENRRWNRNNRRPADASTFKRDILPGLQAFSLSVLMQATGLSESACSRVRAGQVIPHPRHWLALQHVVQGSA